MILPALRGVDAFTIEMDGETFIGMRDPEGIVEDQLMLSQAAFVIAAFLDGQRDEREVQQELAKHFKGQIIAEEDILKVVGALDEHGFLLSDKFHAIRNGVRKRFAQQKIRKAYLAGKSYPDDSSALKTFLDAQFLREGSPQKLPFSGQRSSEPLKCLIAPHIDLHRGGHSYAWAYECLALRPKPETVLIFGTAHAAPPLPFILTRKDFETPFGTVSCDSESVNRLAKSCSWPPFEYELLHRTEHSIEFQVLMLSYLYGTSFKIIPILCGAFCEETEKTPHPNVELFLNEAKQILIELGNSSLVICGADLAHVGKRYGDPFDVDAKVISHVDERDHQDLEPILACDADTFFSSVMKDTNERRVCGLNNIYAALKVLPEKSKGKLLHYGYAHDPMGGIVSFASVAF
ncbi:MAG TPA: AmmeMemoRadiSam system protein B [Acidobacteriota bacterium]|nr:AmmeMemoRadiSam system protein B [Acidobacteriota bacterium]